jgi:hypothetical protein
MKEGAHEEIIIAEKLRVIWDGGRHLSELAGFGTGRWHESQRYIELVEAGGGGKFGSIRYSRESARLAESSGAQ